MRAVGWFGALVLFWILVQACFVMILWPEMRAPVVILSLALACVASPRWTQGFAWSVVAVVGYDIFTSGALTQLSIVGMAIAVLGEFLMQRIVVGDQRWRQVVLGLSTAGLVGVYEAITPWLTWPRLVDIVWALPISLGVTLTVDRLTVWLDETSFSEFRGLRHS